MTPKASPFEVGRRLGSARLQRGLAQGVVARRAGIAPSYLSRIENAKVQPTFRTVMRIVDVLKADLSEIVQPDDARKKRRGPCPVTTKGHCLLDVIRPEADPEHYTARQVKLLRLLGDWVQTATPDRLRAMEILLDDLMRAVKSEP